MTSKQQTRPLDWESQIIVMRGFNEATLEATTALQGLAKEGINEADAARKLISELTAQRDAVKALFQGGGGNQPQAPRGEPQKTGDGLVEANKGQIGNLTSSNSLTRGLSVAVLGFDIFYRIYDILAARQAEREASALDVTHFAMNYGVGATPQERLRNTELEKKAVEADAEKYGVDKEAAWESHKRLIMGGVSREDVQAMSLDI